MAQEKYIYGIKSVKFGAPTGNDTMPGTLTPWAQTVRGSFTLGEDEATKKEFKVEETNTPVKDIVTDAGALTGKWRAYDLTPSLVAIVKGGTAGTTGAGADRKSTYRGPKSVVSKELALQVETTNGVIINIFKASVVARFDGSVSADNLLEMEVSAKALAADSNATPGEVGDPYEFQLPNPE